MNDKASPDCLHHKSIFDNFFAGRVDMGPHDKFPHTGVDCKIAKLSNDHRKTKFYNYTGETEHQTWNSDKLQKQFEDMEDMGLGFKLVIILSSQANISQRSYWRNEMKWYLDDTEGGRYDYIQAVIVFHIWNHTNEALTKGRKKDLLLFHNNNGNVSESDFVCNLLCIWD